MKWRHHATAVALGVVLALLVASCGTVGNEPTTARGILQAMGDLSLNLPTTLSDSDDTARANVPYDTLPAITSEAFSHFNLVVGSLAAQVEGINQDLDMVESDVVSETASSRERSMRRPWQTAATPSGSHTTSQPVAMTRSTSWSSQERSIRTANYLGGSYIEAHQSGEETVTGQAMYDGVDPEADTAHRTKIVFDTATAEVNSYHIRESAGEVVERSHARITEDPDDTANNGVYMAVRFEGDTYGVQSHVGWANDTCGFLSFEHAPPRMRQRTSTTSFSRTPVRHRHHLPARGVPPCRRRSTSVLTRDAPRSALSPRSAGTTRLTTTPASPPTRRRSLRWTMSIRPTRPSDSTCTVVRASPGSFLSTIRWWIRLLSERSSGWRTARAPWCSPEMHSTVFISSTRTRASTPGSSSDG